MLLADDDIAFQPKLGDLDWLVCGDFENTRLLNIVLPLKRSFFADVYTDKLHLL